VNDRARVHVSKIEGIDGDHMHGTNEEGLPVVTDMRWNPSSFGDCKADPKFYRLPECSFTIMVDPGFVSLSVKAGMFKVVRAVPCRRRRSARPTRCARPAAATRCSRTH
jgi:hypothetical protein